MKKLIYILLVLVAFQMSGCSFLMCGDRGGRLTLKGYKCYGEN